MAKAMGASEKVGNQITAKKLRNDKLKISCQSRTSGHLERLLRDRRLRTWSDFPQGKLIIS